MKLDRQESSVAGARRPVAGSTRRRLDMERDSSRVPDAGPSAGEREASLEELVTYLRQKRSELREQWASRIGEAQLLRVMSQEEIFSEVTAVYDNYVDALETGSVETLQA